jgi:1-acyl-sn-glycerol-3-phosphate acyltransferase
MYKLIARLFLWATGWKPEGVRPEAAKYVLIAAPHTSNWDLPYLLALASVFDVKISWMGKHTIFKRPFGRIMKALGGVPIRRDLRHNMVKQMAQAFEESDSLTLVVPTEGTRGRASYWKSGFYHIAKLAEVPIVMGYLDYARRRGGFGPAIPPSDDLRLDMEQIRDFYADKVGKYPELFGEVRLKEEM